MEKEIEGLPNWYHNEQLKTFGRKDIPLSIPLKKIVDAKVVGANVVIKTDQFQNRAEREDTPVKIKALHIIGSQKVVDFFHGQDISFELSSSLVLDRIIAEKMSCILPNPYHDLIIYEPDETAGDSIEELNFITRSGDIKAALDRSQITELIHLRNDKQKNFLVIYVGQSKNSWLFRFEDMTNFNKAINFIPLPNQNIKKSINAPTEKLKMSGEILTLKDGDIRCDCVVYDRCLIFESTESILHVISKAGIEKITLPDYTETLSSGRVTSNNKNLIIKTKKGIELTYRIEKPEKVRDFVVLLKTGLKWMDSQNVFLVDVDE